MHNINYRRLFIATAAFITVSIAALWSLNVVSGLFGGPELQYKHVLAGLIILAVLKLGPTGRHDIRERRHDHQAH